MTVSFVAACLLLLTLAIAAWGQGEVPSSARSHEAVERVSPGLKTELREAGLRFGAPIFVRIFKEPKTLEMWLHDGARFKLFKSYKVCSYGHGGLGPKTKHGDGKAPEGFYFVTPRRLNPLSDFHLSFDLGYPNAYERARGWTGSALMVHGSCVSIGCYAMTDPSIEEIYALADAAFRDGQRFFRVHIFPFEMTAENMKRHASSEWTNFWQNLREGYDFFEQHDHNPPNVEVRGGRYVFEAAAGPKRGFEPTQAAQDNLVNNFKPKLLIKKDLAEGLCYMDFQSPIESKFTNISDKTISVLRIDPNHYQLRLLCASEHDKTPKTVKQWCEEFGLVAGINAGMFQSENRLRNVGLMRNFEHVNNGRLGGAFGAVLAFNRKEDAVPEVQIIDRYNQDLEGLMPKYNSLAQCYRIISAKQTNCWAPKDRIYSMVAVGIDKQGNVLFLFTRAPYSIHDFGNIILALPINLHNAMYLEGGPEATLFVSAGDLNIEKFGSYETDFWADDTNNRAWAVPNVIGVCPKPLKDR